MRTKLGYSHSTAGSTLHPCREALSFKDDTSILLFGWFLGNVMCSESRKFRSRIIDHVHFCAPASSSRVRIDYMLVSHYRNRTKRTSSPPAQSSLEPGQDSSLTGGLRSAKPG